MALPSETLSPSLALPLRVKREPMARSLPSKDGFWLIDANGRSIALVGPAEDAELRAQQIAAACNYRVLHEDALSVIAQKSEAAVSYLQDSGEMLFLQYAEGSLDTARAALDGKPLPFPAKETAP